MPRLDDAAEYQVLIPALEKPLREAIAIGWGDDTKTTPTPQHIAALTFELEVTRNELAQSRAIVRILAANAMPEGFHS